MLLPVEQGRQEREQRTKYFGEAPSDDAGEYLCNYVFYRLMRTFDFIPSRGFVHTPRLWSADTPDGRGYGQIRAAMTAVVQGVVSQGAA